MKKNHRYKFNLVKLSLVCADLMAITLIFAIFVYFRKMAGGEFLLASYFKLYPFLLLFWAVFEKSGLYQGCSIYSGASIGPVEEIRRTFYAVSAIFLGLGFANYTYRPNDYLYSRTILLGTYAFCLFVIPLNRLLLRKLFTHLNVWGVSTVIIGSGETAADIYQKLSAHPEYGLRPIGYFSNNGTHQNRMPEEALNLGRLDKIYAFIKKTPIKYAIIAKDEIEPTYIQSIVKTYGEAFPHILFIPQLNLDSSAWVTPKDISGTLGLEIRHNLLIPDIYRNKRIIDFLLTIPCLLFGCGVMALIALLVKWDSPGPVLFKHRRITRAGGTINIYKFRTMNIDAQERLESLLKSDPALKEQWEKYGKLDHDPRITRMGEWLRKTSLDELPQLLNVLQGKITLVGPRPIIADELRHYGDDADLFDKVLPGITGLWQVSGRNELTYKERVRLDKYYVNNWSVWLDIYILAKTFVAVLFRHGAR
jgi:Undecaprenyl-phosphate galactose phosphotransferase WbaP